MFNLIGFRFWKHSFNNFINFLLHSSPWCTDNPSFPSKQQIKVTKSWVLQLNMGDKKKRNWLDAGKYHVLGEKPRNTSATGPCTATGRKLTSYKKWLQILREVKTDSLVLNRGAKSEKMQHAKRKFFGTPVWFTDVYANNQRLIQTL